MTSENALELQPFMEVGTPFAANNEIFRPVLISSARKLSKYVGRMVIEKTQRLRIPSQISGNTIRLGSITLPASVNAPHAMIFTKRLVRDSKGEEGQGGSIITKADGKITGSMSMISVGLPAQPFLEQNITRSLGTIFGLETCEEYCVMSGTQDFLFLAIMEGYSDFCAGHQQELLDVGIKNK